MQARGLSQSAADTTGRPVALRFALACAAAAGALTGHAFAQTPAPLPATQAAVSAFLAQRNADAARLGLAALEQDPRNHDLRLKTAKALAWTGQYPEALRQFGLLLDTPLREEAILGRANVHLWKSQAHLAVPMYTSLLAGNPANAEATEGLARARTLLRPRTTFRAATLKDSEDAARDVGTVSHQWRSADTLRVYELSVGGGRETQASLVPDLKPRDLSFQVEDFSLPLSPRLKVETQDSPVSKGFAELSVKLADDAVTIDLGRVNWAKVAFSPQSRRDGLTANKIGISGRYDGGMGHVSGTFTRYAISDDNVVRTAAAEYWPAWQPFPASSGVKVFTGLFSYKADRNVARYWSPAAGHSIAFVGASYGVWEKEYEFTATVKRAFLIGGEGTGGAHLSLGGKRWLNKDWAVRAEAYLLDSGRSGRDYRSRSLSVALERYW